MTSHSAILEGIRVVDLTRVLTGPYCTMMLGDMGADILKVERPGSGDDTRQWGPPFVDGESAYFLSINRNKRSLTLNLKEESGKEALWRLIDSADVLVENFRPGTMAKLGFDYESVKARKSELIVASISGFGQEGPGSGLTAYDLIVQGMSGMMSITGPPEMPTKFGVPIADLAAGMFCASAILGALFHRERTGEGQYIDTSMLGGQMALLTYQAGIYFTSGQAPQSTWNAHGIVGPYQTVRTKDGFINIACGNDAIWQRFCDVMGLDALASDPTFANNAGRMAHLPHLIEQIEAAFSTLTTAVIVEKLTAVGVPNGPIYTVAQAFEQPQATHYGMRQHIEHSTIGTIDQIGFPYQLSQTPCEIRLAPPTLGQHTAEILAEVGYDDSEVAALRHQNVI